MKTSLYFTITGLILVSQGYAQQPTYYYNGKQRVNVAVQTRGASTTKTQALARSGASLAAEPAVLRPLGDIGESADQILTQQLSFKLKPGTTLKDVESTYKFSHIRNAGFRDDIYIAEVPATDSLLSLKTANALHESGAVEWASPLIARQQTPRLIPNDTYFNNQWSLRNTGTVNGGIAGNDINVTPAWDVATGAGVNIAIADQGVRLDHPDLAANIRADIDWDFNYNDDDPTPFSNHNHGSACAGIAAARTNNNVGIAGIAHQAGIVGLRLIAAHTTDQQEADSLLWQHNDPNPANVVSVNSNSWGPDDDGIMMGEWGPGPLVEAALETGATSGRQGKGVVYVWAAGNGGLNNDNVNRDRYANSPYVIAVGATDSAGSTCFYSERGAPILVNTSSGDNFPNDNIYTTNNSSYINNFNGTSAAAPAAAGVVALMLHANPALTYRDVMHILVKTAVKNAPLETSWMTNAAGLHFSHFYGFGRVNAGEAVTTSSAWVNVPALAAPLTHSYVPPSPVTIPDNNPSGVQFVMPISGSVNFSTEHVELEVDITHPRRGHLAIELISPSGTASQLLTVRSGDNNPNISHWKFRTVANWDETPNGNWTVKITDTINLYSGVLNSLNLKVMGYEKTGSPSAAENWYLY